MSHDPLCPWFGRYKPRAYPCDCQLIARVREDEQENARKAVEAQAKRTIEIADIQAAWSAATAAVRLEFLLHLDALDTP